MTNGAIETISLLASSEKRDFLSAEQTTQKRLGTVLFYGIVVILAYFVFLVFQPFLAALAIETGIFLLRRHQGALLGSVRPIRD